MKSRRIPILENFALISVIMPYYGPTHKMFLVLSSFSAKSRDKLDEYYDEFRNVMAKYSLKIRIVDCKLATWKLPCDLFKFKFAVTSK